MYAQAQADDIYIKNGTKTWDEVRESLGLDAYNNSLSGGPLAFGMPIYSAVDSAQQVADQKQPALPAGEGEGEGEGEVIPPTPKNKPKQKTKIANVFDLARRIAEDAEFIEDANKRQIMTFISAARDDARMTKTHPGMTINPHHYSLHGETARKRIQDIVKAQLGQVADKIIEKVKKVTKKVRKASEDDIRKILDDDEFWTSLWIDMPENLTPELEAAVRAGMAKGMLEAGVNISQTDMINAFNAIAHDYASKRAAEMVGMKYVDGELQPNPNAQYVISDTTRTEIRNLVTRSFEQETKIDELVKDISDAGAFGMVRAQLIANTEVNRAQAGGTYSVWEKTGVVKTVRWQHSNLPNVCEHCVENAEAGEIEFGKSFPSGELYPPAHPNCRCVVYAVKTTV